MSRTLLVSTFLITLCLSVVIVVQAAGNTMGGFLGANEGLFAVLNPVINQLLNAEVKNVTIPNVNENKNDISFDISSISITSFTCNNCVALALNDNYISVNLHDLSLGLHLDYAAEWKKIIHIHAHGHCSPNVEDVSIGAHATFGNPSSSGAPTIQVSDLSIHIGKLHMGCSGITGVVVDALGDIIKVLAGKILNGMIERLVDKEINKILAKLKLQTTIDKGFAVVDYSIVPSKTFITNAQLQIGVLGQVYPAAVGPNGINYPFPAPTSFTDTCSGNQVQVGLSAYTFNTAFYTYYWANRMNAVFHNVVKSGVLEVFVPGFAKALGKDAELNMTIAASGAATFKTNQTSKSLSLAVPVNLTLFGGPSGQYYYTLGATVFAQVSVTISTANASQPVVHLQIPSLTFLGPRVLSSNVGGELSGPLVMGVLDKVLQTVVLAPINWFLRLAGIPLPAFAGFEIYNPEISYNDDGICIALNIKQQL